MLELTLGVEFILCVVTWSFLGQLLNSSQFYQYTDNSVTPYMSVAQTMIGISFAVLVAFWLPALASWIYVHSDRRFKKKPVFPRSPFYIGLVIIFSVVKVRHLSSFLFSLFAAATPPFKRTPV